MRIAPKPKEGQEVSLERLLQAGDSASKGSNGDAKAKEASKLRKDLFTINYKSVWNGLVEFSNVRVWDGNGGCCFATIEMYEQPFLVKDFETFLHMNSSYVDVPTTRMEKARRWFSTWRGWTLPTGFRPASAPTIFGLISDLANEGYGAFDEINNHVLSRMFPQQVFNFGIYTGTWVTGGPVSQAQHNDCSLYKSSIVTDFTRDVLPGQATQKETILWPGKTQASRVQFEEDCNAIFGTWDLTSLKTALENREPHFRLLTQFYDKPIGRYPGTVALPVIISSNLDEIRAKSKLKPDSGYVYAVRLVTK